MAAKMATIQNIIHIQSTLEGMVKTLPLGDVEIMGYFLETKSRVKIAHGHHQGEQVFTTCTS